jgi:hypothetical protein
MVNGSGKMVNEKRWRKQKGRGGQTQPAGMMMLMMVPFGVWLWPTRDSSKMREDELGQWALWRGNWWYT